MVLVNLRLFLILWRRGCQHVLWEVFVLHICLGLFLGGGTYDRHRVSRIAYSVSHKSCRPGCGAQLIAMGGLGVGRGASSQTLVGTGGRSGGVALGLARQPSTASGQGPSPRPQSSGAPVFEC